jgi:ComB9 competence protein
MRKILAVALVLALAPAAQAAPIDEVRAGGATPDSAIINRPMNDKLNLEMVQGAFDKSDPRANVSRKAYDPNVTYKIRLREYMVTTIILPAGEKITGYNLGNKVVFTFTPLGVSKKDGKVDNFDNKGEVFAKYAGADTNLTIFGESGNIYSFYLRCDSVFSDEMPQLVYYIDDPATTEQQAKPAPAEGTKDGEKTGKPDAQANAPKTEAPKTAEEADYLRSLPLVDPSKISYGYKVKAGDMGLKPVRIFDDSFFTYFQFSDEGNFDKTSAPIVYIVKDGHDVPVNNRVVNGTIIAEAISDKWTIRAGEKFLCVRSVK